MNFEAIIPLFLSLSIIDLNSYMILFCLFILSFNFSTSSCSFVSFLIYLFSNLLFFLLYNFNEPLYSLSLFILFVIILNHSFHTIIFVYLPALISKNISLLFRLSVHLLFDSLLLSLFMHK